MYSPPIQSTYFTEYSKWASYLHHIARVPFLMTSPDPSYTVHLLDIAGVLILELGVVRVVRGGAAHAVVRGGEAQAIRVSGSLGQVEL